IDFIGGLVLCGLAPTALPHRKVTILDEPTERRLRIWPFARLLWSEFLCDQRLQPVLSLPLSEIANATQRNGSLSSLSFTSYGICHIAPEISIDLLAMFGDPAILMTRTRHERYSKLFLDSEYISHARLRSEDESFK